MSASARGIVLGTEDGRLVVEASDSEVAEFARGDLVEAVRLNRPAQQGFGGLYMYGPMSVPVAWPSSGAFMSTINNAPPFMSAAAMASVQPPLPGNAVLRTRCGCERWLDLPSPPPPTWRVPINDGPAILASVGDTAQVQFSVRSFNFNRELRDGHGCRYFEYVESPQ